MFFIASTLFLSSVAFGLQTDVSQTTTRAPATTRRASVIETTAVAAPAPRARRPPVPWPESDDEIVCSQQRTMRCKQGCPSGWKHVFTTGYGCCTGFGNCGGNKKVCEREYPCPIRRLAEDAGDLQVMDIALTSSSYIGHMIQDTKVCSPVHLIGTYCSNCDVEACEAGCSGDENCGFFGFSSVGGLCYLYEKCDQKVVMDLKFDTYKKTFAASDVLGDDLSGQPAVPMDVPAPGAPAPEGPGDEGSDCDPSYEPVTATENSSTSCAKDWIIERKYNELAPFDLCAEECTKDANCMFFGLSTFGTCVTFAGCETTRATGQTWTTYRRVESTDPACSISSDDVACATEPYTTSVLIGPDAWSTCSKSTMIRKEMNGGATEEYCRKACEVQHKTWQEGDDQGQCKFFGLSETGVCILYEECSETRLTPKRWTTWEMAPPACATNAPSVLSAARRMPDESSAPETAMRRSVPAESTAHHSTETAMRRSVPAEATAHHSAETAMRRSVPAEATASNTPRVRRPPVAWPEDDDEKVCVMKRTMRCNSSCPYGWKQVGATNFGCCSGWHCGGHRKICKKAYQCRRRPEDVAGDDVESMEFFSVMLKPFSVSKAVDEPEDMIPVDVTEG